MAQEIEGGECQPYFEGILDYADRCMRDTLRSFPDGVFEGADKMDSDCFADRDIWIRVKLTKRADKLVVDFSGTDPQIRGFKNSPLANTFSSVYVAVTAFLAPKIPRNEGTYRSIEIIAPEGSLVNPLPPAPQTMSTVHPNHEIVHACWQALGQARPDLGCAGWGKLCQPNMSADRPGGGKYVMYHWGAYPGAGAVNGRDGFHQMGSVNNLGALSVPNCEDYEQVYPVRFLRHELREDAGGPGQFRGGTGVIYEVQVEADAEFAFRSEGVGAPTGYGVAGGGPGAGGEIELTLVDGRQITPPRFSLVGFGPLTMRILSAAGGGWGDPKLRDPASVLRDVRDGIVSDRAAREIYGVALKSGNREIDERATRSLRANSRC
jgi:N-methylhydantoinase B